MIRLQGTCILLSFFNLPFNRPALESIYVSILGQCWGILSLGYTAHTGSDTSFSQRALAEMELGWLLVVSTAESRIWTNAVINTLWCRGKAVLGGQLEMLFGVVSKLSQLRSSLGMPQLLPLLEQEQHHLQMMPQPGLGWHRSPTRVTSGSTVLEGQATTGCPCATRALCWEGPGLQGAV